MNILIVFGSEESRRIFLRGKVTTRRRTVINQAAGLTAIRGAGTSVACAVVRVEDDMRNLRGLGEAVDMVIEHDSFNPKHVPGWAAFCNDITTR